MVVFLIVFLNGDYVDETEAKISIFDRGFTLGDGLFEAVRIKNKNPFRLDQHLARLEQSAKELEFPFSGKDLEGAPGKLLERNNFHDGILRISLSRGFGARGYSLPKDTKPTVAVSLHSIPVERMKKTVEGFKVITSSFRIPPFYKLGQHKTSSRMLNVLAFREAEELGADEALFMNTEGHLTEGSASNLFWIENKTVCTTPQEVGVLPGITRAAILQCCIEAGIEIKEGEITPEELFQAHGGFLTYTSLGVAEILNFDNHGLARSPLVAELSVKYNQKLEAETR
jgi:branched-subunit amino acid aminotransferase/4-amino-4-deoxychorismate lyase